MPGRAHPGSAQARPMRVRARVRTQNIMYTLHNSGRYTHNLAMSSITEAVKIAACRMGFSKLTPQQEQATTAFVNGNDVFVSLPTGSGKTACFAVLPFTFDILHGEQGCIVMVVSPLTALMKDQVSW